VGLSRLPNVAARRPWQYSGIWGGFPVESCGISTACGKAVRSPHMLSRSCYLAYGTVPPSSAHQLWQDVQTAVFCADRQVRMGQ